MKLIRYSIEATPDGIKEAVNNWEGTEKQSYYELKLRGGIDDFGEGKARRINKKRLMEFDYDSSFGNESVRVWCFPEQLEEAREKALAKLKKVCDKLRSNINLMSGLANSYTLKNKLC